MLPRLVTVVLLYFILTLLPQVVLADTYDVWGHSTFDPMDRPFSEPFDTEAEAIARMEQIKRDHGPGGVLQYDKNRPEGLYVRKNGSPFREEKRSRFAAIKAASEQLQQRYQQAKNMKAKLKSFQGKVSPAQLAAVNDIISGYNQSRTQFRDVYAASSPATLSECPVITTISENELQGQTDESNSAGKSKQEVDTKSMALDESLRRAEQTALEEKRRKLEELKKIIIQSAESGKDTAELEKAYLEEKESLDKEIVKYDENRFKLIDQIVAQREERQQRYLEQRQKELAAKEEAERKKNLVGRKWTVYVGGSTPLEIEFKEKNKIVANYAKRNDGRDGTWVRNGDSVSISVSHAGRPGFSSYSSGYQVQGKINASGELEFISLSAKDD